MTPDILNKYDFTYTDGQEKETVLISGHGSISRSKNSAAPSPNTISTQAGMSSFLARFPTNDLQKLFAVCKTEALRQMAERDKRQAG